MQVDKRQMHDDNERREIKMMESMKSAVEAAVGKLSGELQRDLEHWEGKMDEKVRAHLTSHQAEFEQKWATKIAQLELESRDGVISSAEFRIQKNIAETLDKNWQSRMEKEEKIKINGFETLNSIVTRLEAEVLKLKGKYSNISAASTVPTSSSGSGGSHTGLRSPGAPSEWVPTRIELKGWVFGGKFDKLVLQWMRLRTWWID